jgi:hypothetical protein
LAIRVLPAGAADLDGLIRIVKRKMKKSSTGPTSSTAA